MPSPCEVVPDAFAVDPASMIMLDIDGRSGTARRSRGSVHRVVPALAGGVFAGLLLIGLGCTPFFQPQGAKAAHEQATIVLAEGSASTQDAAHDTAAGSLVVSATPMIVGEGGVSTPKAIPAADSGTSPDQAHGFMIVCEGVDHTGEDAAAPRPETVALQGIMASNSMRAALLNGVMYREGDHFGSHRCPWTVAMIDSASVRIEKTFGDRVCGVTIRFHNEKAATPTTAPSSRTNAAVRTSQSRSR